MRGLVIAGFAVAALLLGGCAVGPDFTRPDAPPVDRYDHDATPTATADSPGPAGAAQHFTFGRDIPGEWWTLFQSPALNTLITEAIADNPDLETAEAALRQAHELTLAGEGAFFPTLQAGFSASRNKTPTGSLSPATSTGNPYYSLYTPQLSVAYTLDVFGGTRRQVEALEAQEDEQRAQLEAAYLTLTANLVAAAVTEAALRGQIAATGDIIAGQREALDILRRQQGLGQAAGSDVAAQEAALAQAESTLPPLQKALEQQHHLLAVLTGHFPSERSAPTFDLASLRLPQNLPVSLPSRLVEQRPDIRLAEAQLHAASAEIGVATANMLPQISLSANVGSSALQAASLFGPGTSFFSIAGNVAQTLFDGGTLLHRKRAADAAFDQAAAQFRSTVLNAFQNVADVLRAVQSDADALRAATASEQAASTSLDITRRQLSLGAVNRLALITAEQAYAQAHLNRVQAEAARFADTAALFQALGGGWWNRNDAAAPVAR